MRLLSWNIMSNHVAFQKTFKMNVEKRIAAFKEVGNPFEDDSEVLYAMDTKVVVENCDVKAVQSVIEVGQQQYNDFVK